MSKLCGLVTMSSGATTTTSAGGTGPCRLRPISLIAIPQQPQADAEASRAVLLDGWSHVRPSAGLWGFPPVDWPPCGPGRGEDPQGECAAGFEPALIRAFKAAPLLVGVRAQSGPARSRTGAMDAFEKTLALPLGYGS